MKIDKVKALLERYYQGTTTREEEARLRAWFKNNEVPEALKADQVLFNSMNALYSDPENTDQANALQRPYPITRSLNGNRRFFSIAASLLFLVISGIVLYMGLVNTNKQTYNAYSDKEPHVQHAYRNNEALTPEEAKKETVKAIGLFGEAMETSEAELRKLNDLVNE